MTSDDLKISVGLQKYIVGCQDVPQLPVPAPRFIRGGSHLLDCDFQSNSFTL